MSGRDGLEPLQLLRVRGTDTRAALEAASSPASIAAALDAGLVESRSGGGAEYLTLSPEGERAHAEAVAAARREPELAALDQLYERDFIPLNARFKALCAEWQQAGDRWPLIDELVEIDAAIRDFLTAAIAASGHYGRYADGFAAALEAIEQGDVDALTAPAKTSYHSLWFELHEDLLTLLGRSRADEDAW